MFAIQINLRIRAAENDIGLGTTPVVVLGRSFLYSTVVNFLTTLKVLLLN
jgi:hypothetical protein